MLREQIRQDLKEATKQKEEKKLQVLRMLTASVLNREKEKRYKLAKGSPEISSDELEKSSQLTEEEMVEAVFSEVKKRKESILEFGKGGRGDLVEKEKEELEILQKYLPEQISEEELVRLAKEAIEKVGAKEQKDMGKVMAEMMPKVKGRAEGGQVSKIIKELLASAQA